MNNERFKIIEIAKSWLNTPYHKAGRIKGVGCDCGTFLLEVFLEAGLISDIDLKDYSINRHLHYKDDSYINLVKMHTKPSDERLPGNIIMYQWGLSVNHGSIIVDDNTIIHSVIKKGVLLDEMHKSSYKKREIGIYSYW
jgi:cell wall-associated NlpC family hydrolase